MNVELCECVLGIQFNIAEVSRPDMKARRSLLVMLRCTGAEYCGNTAAVVVADVAANGDM